MAEINDIVAGAMADAEEGITPEPAAESGTDETAAPDATAEGDTSGEAAAPAEVSPTAGTTEPPAPDAAALQAQKEQEEEFAKYGIHPPKPGQREGTFRWSKVQKVVENARKKTAEKFQRDIEQRDRQIQATTERLKQMDAVDQLIVRDPDRYIQALAALHPQYQKFLRPPAAPEQKPVDQDPKPGPDAKFEDGSLGYSPEGLDALMAWQSRQVERTVAARLDEQYGKRLAPIEQSWKQQEEARLQREQEEALRPRVRDQIMQAKKTWGNLFQSKLAGDKEDDPAIVKALAEHPDWSFDACVAHVLRPKTQADRDAMRKSILDELKKAPAAASHLAPGAGGGGETGPRTIEQIVTESIRAATAGQ